MLQANQTEVQLGTVHFGKEYIIRYTLTNTFQEDVKILAYVPGCKACTTVSLTKDTLKNGEQTEVEAVFTPGSLGVANKTVNIVYSVEGRTQPELILKFKGVVVE